MQKNLIHNALLGCLLLATAPAMATGFVTLKPTGTNTPLGTTAYVRCNVTGNFGSNPNGSTPPTFSPNGGNNNACALARINPPLVGYSLITNTIRNIVMNNAYTLNQPITIGTLADRVWRKDNSCIYGAKVRLHNVDYDRRSVSPGIQYFELNDLLRGGFKNRGTIQIGYHFTTAGGGASDDVLYRAGLTYTSVVNKPGDFARPLTSVAPISLNWVDFTSDISYLDDDGSSVRDSAWLLVKSNCTAAAPTPLSGGLVLRQMGQEEQPLIEIKMDGFAPAGGNTAP